MARVSVDDRGGLSLCHGRRYGERKSARLFMLRAEVGDGAAHTFFQRKRWNPAEVGARPRAVEIGEVNITSAFWRMDDRRLMSHQPDELAM